MAVSSSASLSSKDFSKAATTGFNLTTKTEADFGTNASMAGCEMFNVSKDSIQSAAQADMILCYVKYIASQQGVFGANVDIYDGNWHVFDMNLGGGGGEGTPKKIKMRIQKTGDSITGFAMHMCKDNGNGGVAQNEYVNQEITGSTFHMTAKGNYADNAWSGSHYVYVDGSLNSSGAYTRKAITVKNKGTGSGQEMGQNFTSSNWSEGLFTQVPGQFSYKGYQRGSFTMGQNSNEYSRRAYGAGEMLGDTNTAITNLAIGDGAVHAVMTNEFSWNGFTDSFTNANDQPFYAWSGDDMSVVSPATSSSFYTIVETEELPQLTNSANDVVIAFEGSEDWDCADTAEGTIEGITEAAMGDACSEYASVNGGGRWIDCYRKIQMDDEQQKQQ